MIERRPEMIQRLVNVMVRTNKWMAANPVEKWAEVLPADLVGDRAVCIESMKTAREMFTADSLPTREEAIERRTRLVVRSLADPGLPSLRET